MLTIDPDRELAVGGSLQIRNATIDFTSADGTMRRTNRDIGPVPLIKFRIKHTFKTGWFIGGEIDGIYAPVKYLNGSNTDVVGALLDRKQSVLFFQCVRLSVAASTLSGRTLYGLLPHPRYTLFLPLLSLFFSAFLYSVYRP